MIMHRLEVSYIMLITYLKNILLKFILINTDSSIEMNLKEKFLRKQIIFITKKVSV